MISKNVFNNKILKKFFIIFWLLFIINLNIGSLRENSCFADEQDGSVKTATEEKTSFMAYTEPQQEVPVSSKGIIFKMGLCLVAVVMLIMIFLVILKKVVGTSYGNFGGKAIIKILDKSYIEPKKSVCVLKVLDRLLVLGVHQGGFTPITEIHDPAFTETVKDSDETKDFFEYLNLETKTDMKKKDQDFLYKIGSDLKSIKEKFLNKK